MTVALRPKTVIQANMTYIPGAEIKLGSYSQLRRKAYPDKLVLTDGSMYGGPISTRMFRLNRSLRYDNTVITPPKLYISKKSRISRDMLRAGGYKIVLDPSNADSIVVPFAKSTWITQVRCNLAAYTNERLIIIDISRPNGDVYKEEVDRICETVRNSCLFEDCDRDSVKFIYHPVFDLENFVIEFVYDVPEYEEIACCNSLDLYKFVLDENVFCVVNDKVNVDMLEMISRMSDSNMIEKTVMQTNWQDYPYTMVSVLGNSGFYYNSASLSFKNDYIAMLRYSNNEKPITPEDWDMYQRWLMRMYDVPEEGGVIKNINKIVRVQSPNCRVAIYLKPFKINRPMHLREITELMSSAE